MTEDPTHLQVHVDLRALVDGLRRSIQRLVDLVSFGLQAADNPGDIEQLDLPRTFFRFSPSDNTRLSVSEAASAFHSWVLTAGLRDAVEALSEFLESARTVGAIYQFGSREQITGAEWADATEMEANKFHRLGLPDKLDYFNKFGDAFLPEGDIAHVCSINAARNCLVHRQGVVTTRDVNTDSSLTVSWRTLEVVVTGSDGVRGIAAGDRVEAGETVGVRTAQRIKAFGLGDRIDFTEQEFSEICLFLSFLFAKQVVDALEGFGRSMGVPFAMEAH